MAMTGSGLFDAIKAALGTAQDADIQEDALKPMCDAIVLYIQTNAVIATSTPGAQAGGAVLPGTGTIS